ncbi:unnamed protein product [Ambrosiozyma monospora]|uniref:Unnamed protein product n=1 Tax=Ambrosiozyma monospora TaxID=43982 RepID=A0A9W6Z3A0_AMBMO|nr:unnamed protein product [Ambrosiozyma monospora]
MSEEIPAAELSTSSDPNRALKDIIAGTMGGIAQVLVGQPFDTTKVRLQSAKPGQFNGPLDVISQLIKNEGPLAFYKGTLTPLVGVGVVISIQFGVNEYMKRFFNEKNGGEELDCRPKPPV